MGAVLGLLLVAPGLLAFFLRRREAPGQWFGTVLGNCLLLPLVGLAFAGSAGQSLARLSWCMLASGLLSFVMMIIRRRVPIRACYMGAGQHGSGPGVSLGV